MYSALRRLWGLRRRADSISFRSEQEGFPGRGQRPAPSTLLDFGERQKVWIKPAFAPPGKALAPTEN